MNFKLNRFLNNIKYTLINIFCVKFSISKQNKQQKNNGQVPIYFVFD